MCRELATILTARGRLAQARTVIEKARAEQPVLTHLLAVAESDLERTLGTGERPRQLLRNGLAQARESGAVVGTDELWLRMAECDMAADDLAAARRCAAETARVAERIGTGRARLCHLLARVAVYRDSADEAVWLARQRAQPFELAGTLTRVATQGLADGRTLLEAYDLYGDLDALLPRARLRHVMRERDIAVPGRSVTLAENERLLAALVTEGLTNRELAVVLGTSEKSAEGRLSRLFQRTGYRSRVELATAMVTGEYPA
jgi:DNA-binding CsgD family transcriptional regulator